MIDPTLFAPWVSEEAQDLFRAARTAEAPPGEDIASRRAHYDAFNRHHLATALAAFPVDVVRAEMGGVPVDIVEPRGGTVDHRTLICLHGGAFMWGRGAGALLEAVPVAAVTGMRVIAVEYSLAPERVFPAAVEDAIAVFRALTADAPPAAIGVYGCSAGGVLTAQTVAHLLMDGAEPPGAVAMLCGTGLEMAGDSSVTAGPLTGQPGDAPPLSLAALPYLEGCDTGSPLVFPGDHPAMLERFPPGLLATGTRDYAASSVATMHRCLLSAGASAELLHFDGMWHAFHMATTLPESRELFAAMGRFFDRHLR